MKEKCFTNPLRGGAGMLRKGIQFMMLFAMLFGIARVQADTKNPNYGFPNNYEYPYGITVSNPQNDKIVALYKKWIENYYVEDGDLARIKFVQENESGDATVSEGIGYGMLIFVYMAAADPTDTYDEYEMFKKLWNYYVHNYNKNKIMNWKVDAFTGQVVGGDEGNANGATDAELDVAQALLMAYKQWGDDEFLTNGKLMLERIWDFEMDHTLILKPGDAFDNYKNPCYFVTNAMQLFATVDAGSVRDWNTAVDKAYDFILLTQDKGTGLVPDWVNTNYNWESLTSGASMYIKGTEKDKFESYYLYDAIRTQWRMAQTYAWYGHEKAKEICDLANTWADDESNGRPGTLLDGYTLEGDPAHTSGDAFVAGKGKWSNACFGGGFASGGVASDKSNPEWKAFMESGYDYTIGEAVDGTAYFVETTQLLYLLFMSGNMPNFYDMLPEFESAETDADGAKITVYFSKALDASSIAGSLSGWTVKSDFGATENTIESVSNQGDTAVVLSLTDTIMDEYQVVSYDGSADLKSAEKSNLTQFQTDFEVKGATGLSNFQFVVDNRTVKRPIIMTASTDMDGQFIYLALDQEISVRSVRASYFTLKGKGGRSILIDNATVDISEKNKIVLEIGGDITEIIQENDADDLMLSYDGSISASNGQKLKAFVDRKVLNLVVRQKCTTIDDFDDHENPIGIWSKPWSNEEPFDEKALNPDKTGINADDNCLQYIKPSGVLAQSAPKFTFNDYYNSILATEGKFQFTFQLYTPNAVGDTLTFHFHDSQDPDDGPEGTITKYTPGNNLEFSYIIPATAKDNWWPVVIDMENEKDFQKNMDEFELAINKPTGPNAKDVLTTVEKEIYFDNFKFCTPVPVTELKSALINTDGSAMILKFGDVMGTPADPSEFKVSIDGGTPIDADTIWLDQDEPTRLYLKLKTSFSGGNDVTVSYNGATAKSAAGRPLTPFNDFKVMNGIARVVTTGWADEFETTNDFVTNSLGGDNVYDFQENNDGTLTLTSDATGTGYKSWGITLQDELWDLSNNQKVQMRLKCDTEIYIRVDLKDYIDDRNTDVTPIYHYTNTGSFDDVEFDFTGLWKNMYTKPGAVDKTALHQAIIYVWTDVPTEGAPTLFSGDIIFDYIRIGAALTLSLDGSPNINQGESLNASCNEPCTMYVVPKGTVRDIKELETAVADEKGISVAAPTAGVSVDLGLDVLLGGDYDIYAYSPTTGAISIKQQVFITDNIAPELTFLPPTVTNVYQVGSFAMVELNEDGYVVLIDGKQSLTDGKTVINAKYLKKVRVKAGQRVGFELDKISTANQFRIVASDDAYNLSNATELFDVVDTRPMTISVITTQVDWPESEDAVGGIEFTASKQGEVHLVRKGTEAKESLFNLDNIDYVYNETIDAGEENTVQTLAFSDIYLWYDYWLTEGEIGTVAEEQGVFWLYAEDTAGNYYGPETVIIGEAQTNNVASASLDPSADFTLKDVGTQSDITLNIVGEDETSPADVKTVEWLSDNPDAVSVSGDKTGATVTVLGAGAAKITVTITDMSGAETSVFVTVTGEVDVVASSIKVTTPANSEIELLEGQSVTVEATVEPVDDVAQTFTLSSDSEYLSIVGNKITAKPVTSEETATVTVTADASPEGNPITTEITVTLPYNEDVTVTLNPSAGQVLRIEEKLPVTATVLNATDKTVSWEVTEGVGNVSVSDAGVITALAVGSAVVTATSNEDGTTKASINVDVEKRAPKLITVVPSSHTFVLTETIEPITLGVNFGIEDEDAVTNKEIVWSSSDNTVALVGSDGTVAAKATDENATCIIKATSKIDATVFGQCEITFSGDETPLENIIADDFEVMEFQTGAITFEYDPAATTQKGVEFTSSNIDILYVDENGSFQAVAQGEVKVTIESTVTDVTKIITVTVNPFKVTEVAVAVDNFTLDLSENKTGYIETSFLPDFTPSDIEVTYEITAGEGNISVDANGKITALEATDANSPAIVKVYSETNPAEFVEVEVIVAAEAAKVTSVEFKSGFSPIVKQGGTIDLQDFEDQVIIDGTGDFSTTIDFTITPVSKVVRDGNTYTVNEDATGDLTITVFSVTDEAVSDAITVTINEGVTDIDIEAYDATILQGAVFTLSAEAVGGETNEVTWTAEDGLDITSSGEVVVADDQPIGDYDFTVTSVEKTSVKKTITIKVIEKNEDATLQSITIPESITLEYGQEKSIAATLVGDDYAWEVKWTLSGDNVVTLSSETGLSTKLLAENSSGDAELIATVTQPNGTVKKSNTCTVEVKASVTKITGVDGLDNLPSSIKAGESIDLGDILSKQPENADNDLVYVMLDNPWISQDGSNFVVSQNASGKLVVDVKNGIGDILTTVEITIDRKSVVLEGLSLEVDGETFDSDIELEVKVWSPEFAVVATNWDAATEKEMTVEVDDEDVVKLTVATSDVGDVTFKLKGLSAGKTAVTISAVEGDAEISFDVIVTESLDAEELKTYLDLAEEKKKQLRSAGDLAGYTAAKAIIEEAQAVYDDATSDQPKVSQDDIEDQILILMGFVGTGVEDAKANIVIAPVPMVDVLSVSGADVISVSVINSVGVVAVQSDNANIDVTVLPAGTYTVIVETTEGTITVPVTK